MAEQRRCSNAHISTDARYTLAGSRGSHHRKCTQAQPSLTAQVPSTASARATSTASLLQLTTILLLLLLPLLHA
jgi:hypothetical protein